MLRNSRVQCVRVCAMLLCGFGWAGMGWCAWTGAGTAGGDPAATDINDPANWTSGSVNGDFTTITSHAALTLTEDYTATNGLNFADALNGSRLLVIGGTNAVTLQANVPGFPSGTRHLFLPTNQYAITHFRQGLEMKLTGARNISGTSVLVLDALLTGTGPYYNAYVAGYQPISVFRNDANSFTGSVGGDGGRFYFTSIADKGVPCALGAGTSVSPNNITIIYNGNRDAASNRDVSFMHASVGIMNDSACGALSLTGRVYAASLNRTRLALGGVSAGEGLITCGLSNANATSYTLLRKIDSGTWRLTGNNAFTGYTNNTYHIDLEGGRLIADYRDDVTGAGSNRLFLAGRMLSFLDGTLEIVGKAGAGNTTWQLFGTNLINNNSLNVLKADANGGDGTTVALGEILAPYDYGFLRLERSANAAVCLTNAAAPDSGSLRAVNGMILGKDGTRATLLVRDPDGRVGFAAQDGEFAFTRHTGTLALTADNAGKTDHVSLASDLTRTADLNFSTLDIDASAQAVTLDLGGFALQTDNTAVGRGVMVNGAYPAAIRGGAHGAQGSTYLHNYGTAKLSWAVTNGSSLTLVSAGPGLTEISESVLGNLVICEGVTRLTKARTYAEGNIYVFGNGVLEIGADLNTSAAGDFTRYYGSSAGQIYFSSGGGFSAHGADRTVIMNNNAASVLWWGAGGFIPSGKPLILSSPHADATLILMNQISLQNGSRREIRVQNGSAAVDARLTGRIYGYGISSLIKSGGGTLELTGRQDYFGDVSVIGGGLRLGADGVFTGGTNALVLSGATLDPGTARNALGTLEILADSVIEAGDGTAELSFADSRGKTWTGTLTVNGKLRSGTLRFGTDAAALTPQQIASISNRGCTVRLDEQGYLLQNPPGTFFFMR